MSTNQEVALLVPVPLEHLIDGIAVCDRQGKAAFGSRAREIFRQLDKLRNGQPVEVYIYASHAPGRSSFKVSWRGIYLGYVEGIHGAHPQGMQFRPPSTAKYEDDNQGHQAVFWEVAQLWELATQEYIPTCRFYGWDKREFFEKNFIPKGPILVHHPLPLKWFPTLPDAPLHHKKTLKRRSLA
jgi:hypothetical protein